MRASTAPALAPPRQKRWHPLMRASTVSKYRCWILLVPIVLPALPTQGSEQPQQQETLAVIIRATPAAWYFNENEVRGIDHDLLAQFAESLGLQLEVTHAPDTGTALKALCNPQAQLAAGLLTLPPSIKNEFRVSPDYGTARPRLIRYFPLPDIASAEELVMETIEIGAEPAHMEILAAIKKRNGDTTRWNLHEGIGAHERIELTDHGFIEYTVVDSHAIQMTRRFYPRVKEGIHIGPELPLNWAFGPCADAAVVESGREFLTAAKANGTLAQVFDRYLGHAEQLDYPEKLTFLEGVNRRLGKYKPAFVRVARETAMNWTLLAALSYQESRWAPEAKSPSGVEGLMMLTLDVAGKFGVENRKDPDQSIRGGAYFLLDLKQRLPPEVKDPDRTWFALAAYNVGLESVRNAMKRTRDRGLNPSLWINTRDFLNAQNPASAESQANSPNSSLNNPYLFVYNIRAYRDLLAWNDRTLRFYESDEKPQKKPPLSAPATLAPM